VSISIDELKHTLNFKNYKGGGGGR
jgi:hypothetical protein